MKGDAAFNSCGRFETHRSQVAPENLRSAELARQRDRKTCPFQHDPDHCRRVNPHSMDLARTATDASDLSRDAYLSGQQPATVVHDRSCRDLPARGRKRPARIGSTARRRHEVEYEHATGPQGGECPAEELVQLAPVHSRTGGRSVFIAEHFADRDDRIASGNPSRGPGRNAKAGEGRTRSCRANHRRRNVDAENAESLPGEHSGCRAGAASEFDHAWQIFPLVCLSVPTPGPNKSDNLRCQPASVPAEAGIVNLYARSAA